MSIFRKIERDGVTFVIEVDEDPVSKYGVKSLRFDVPISETTSGKTIAMGYAVIYKAKSAVSNTANVELMKHINKTKGLTFIEAFQADGSARNTGYSDEDIVALGQRLVNRAKAQWKV